MRQNKSVQPLSNRCSTRCSRSGPLKSHAECRTIGGIHSGLRKQFA